MKTLLRISLTSVLLGLAIPALAQDSGLKPIKPGKKDDLEDLGGWLDDDDETPPKKSAAKKEAPAPAPKAEPDDGEVDPLAPGAKPPAPKPRKLTPYEQKVKAKREGKIIDRNFRDAQRTYDSILKSDPIGPLDRRIKSNQGIIAEYRGKIRTAAKERRQLQVVLYNRSFYLKQQVDKKQITQTTYEKLITQEEEKFSIRSRQLKGLIRAWVKEIRTAKARLNRLLSERKLLEAQRPRKRRRVVRKRGQKTYPGKSRRPGERLITTLRARLRKLSKFESRHTLTNVHPRALGIDTGPTISTRKRSGKGAKAEDELSEDDLDQIEKGEKDPW